MLERITIPSHEARKSVIIGLCKIGLVEEAMESIVAMLNYTTTPRK